MNANRIFALVTALVIAAVLGLGWLLGLSPLLAAAAQADQDRIAVEQTNLAQQATLASMKADFDRLDEIEGDLQALRVAIPNEVDSDWIYWYLDGIQRGTGAFVESITIGAAAPYGQTAEAAEAPAADAAPTSGVAQFEGLYTVPVTITFVKDVLAPDIVAFAGSMQHGPRIFLVTAITRPASSDGTAGTITAYMFVMADRDDTPGASAGSHDDALAGYSVPPVKLWGSQDPDAEDSAPSPTPTPEETETPDPSGSPTPTPTP
jgi:hypothetical protein